MQKKQLNTDIPRHIGYIVDGNRRWAKQHGLPTYEGHLAGYNVLKDIVFETVDKGVPFVSVYIFSVENWKRSEKEVSYLMGLTLKVVEGDLTEMIERGIRVRHIGSRERLSDKVLKALDRAEEKTKHLDRGTVGLCFNYGGHQEIIDATRRCVEDGLKPAEITKESIVHRLYAPDIPPVDLVVRTSGEQRVSNFMLWRTAYSELLFLDKFWPDMTKHDVAGIIEEYKRRSRRFGG
jgi:undecaprenyl diphosphate synthase